MPWAPGDHVTVRYVGHSRRDVVGVPGLLQGWPHVVVQDTPDLLALWMPVGTRMKLVDLTDRERAVPDLVHGARPGEELRRGELVRLMEPGRSHSVWLHWTPDAEHRFLGYYVNLEAPHVRTSIGVDTTDDILDLMVTPDLEWHWKDEEQVPQWVAAEVYTAREMEAIRAHGAAVIADIEARRFPFDGSWVAWRSEAGWSVPETPPDWDLVRGYDLPLSTFRRLKGVDPRFAAGERR